MATAALDGRQLGQALVNFSRDGAFPDENIVSSDLRGSQLGVAIEVLASAKASVEAEIRSVSRDSAVNVDSWIRTAQTLQDDIDRSRVLANNIVRQAEASETLAEDTKSAEQHVEFLLKEVIYTTQVREALQRVKQAKGLLDDVERARDERHILKALTLLEQAWNAIHEIPAFDTSRAVGLLSRRAHELRSSLQDSFNAVWSGLIDVDTEERKLTIRSEAQGMSPRGETDAGDRGMGLQDALTVVDAFKESDQRLQTLHDDIEKVILAPRTSLHDTTSVIRRDGDSVVLVPGTGDRSIKLLLDDIETLVRYLVDRLPTQLSDPLSKLIMPTLLSRITQSWLDSAIPASLDQIAAFQTTLTHLRDFASTLSELQWPGANGLQEWADSAPRIWLAKRREASLDGIRSQLLLGIRTTKQVERVETQTVAKAEGLAFEGKSNDDWNAAWSDDESGKPSAAQSTDDDFDAWDVDNDEPEPKNDDDDAGDAWGWGDEDPEPVEGPKRKEQNGTSDALQEVTLRETYTVSAIPGKVQEAVVQIVQDAIALAGISTEQNPVAPAAAGLFGLPTLVLAMYRAVSPSFYSEVPGGSMYLYNDSMWLAEQLREQAEKWKSEDLPRTAARLNLDADANLLEVFAKHGYGNEMNMQKTILKDLLGGSQNVVSEDMLSAIDGVVARIRLVAGEWERILSKSAWAQAVGSLITSVTSKIIADVEDLPSLGADEAYRVADMITKVVALDDLFLPDRTDGAAIPLTAQYVPNWLKLHFLSEVLQSDLKDVRFLWFESDLSLYFSAEEIVDLIKLSFEMNPRTREVIHAIRDDPHPRAQG